MAGFAGTFKLSGNRTQTLNNYSTYRNALRVGARANTVANEAKKGGVHVYDGQTSILDGTIANFGPGDTFLTFRRSSESTDNTSSFSGLRFVGSIVQRAELTSYLRDARRL